MQNSEWKKLLRDGSVSRCSEEYFNRNKGTNYWLSIKLIDGERYVIGDYVSYPNAPYSEGTNGYVLEKLEKVLQLLEKDEDLGLFRLSAISKEKYTDIRKQVTAIPTCPHCGRIWD